jgi:transporter family-2 protein
MQEHPMHTTAYLITAVVGMSLALQVGLNSIVRVHVGSAAGAALINFVVGTAALATALLVTRTPIPTTGQMAGIPWWAWLAGLTGAAYVASSAVIGSMIGGAAFIALIVAGQMIGAMALDHFGVLGFPVRPVDGIRLAGAVLVVLGVVLLSRD